MPGLHGLHSTDPDDSPQVDSSAARATTTSADCASARTSVFRARRVPARQLPRSRSVLDLDDECARRGMWLLADVVRRIRRVARGHAARDARPASFDAESPAFAGVICAWGWVARVTRGGVSDRDGWGGHGRRRGGDGQCDHGRRAGEDVQRGHGRRAGGDGERSDGGVATGAWRQGRADGDVAVGDVAFRGVVRRTCNRGRGDGARDLLAPSPKICPGFLGALRL